MDPERFLTAAVMWYNRFMLLAPDPDERQKSAEARIKFDEVGPGALGKMTYYLDGASACQQSWRRKGCGKCFLNGGPNSCAFSSCSRSALLPSRSLCKTIAPRCSKTGHPKRLGRPAREELRPGNYDREGSRTEVTEGTEDTEVFLGSRSAKVYRRFGTQ